MLAPYTGHQTRYHLGRSGYAQEFGKTYHFNSLGFRCDDFSSASKEKIFLCGCSHMFGTALNDDETFTHHFKREFTRARGLSPEEVNVQNFATAGASNDYITRMLLTQCARVKPDMVFALFTRVNRTECMLDERGENGSPRITSFGPWCVGDENWRPCDFDSSDVVERAQFYYGYYEAPVGILQLLRNMLLLQYYCRANGIAHLFSVLDQDVLNSPFVTQNEAVAPFAALIDRSLLVTLPPAVDLGGDNGHPGTRTNQARAAAVVAAITARDG